VSTRRTVKGVRPPLEPIAPRYHGLLTKCWAQEPRARRTFSQILALDLGLGP
jgi:hypothetical protein